MAKPFRIAVPDQVIDDLHQRLDATRWPQTLDEVGWDYGSDTAYVAELCRYWRHEYDWRTHEAAINELPQFTQRIDGLDIHFIHAEGKGPDPLPLVITHGWPSCFWEMHKVVGPLAAPRPMAATRPTPSTLWPPRCRAMGSPRPRPSRGCHRPKWPTCGQSSCPHSATSGSAPKAATGDQR